MKKSQHVKVSYLKYMLLLGLVAPAPLFAQDAEEPANSKEEIIFEAPEAKTLPSSTIDANGKTRAHDMLPEEEQLDQQELARRHAAVREYYMKLSSELFRRGQKEYIDGEFESASKSFLESRAEIQKCYNVQNLNQSYNIVPPTGPGLDSDKTNLLIDDPLSDKEIYIKWPETVKKRIMECDRMIAVVYMKWSEKLISESDGLFRDDDPQMAVKAKECLLKAQEMWPEYTPRIQEKIKKCERKLNGLLVNEAVSEKGTYPEKDNINYQINSWLRKGKEYYDIGFLEESTRCYNEVRRLDPYNLEAIERLRVIMLEHRRIAAVRVKQQRKSMIAAVNNVRVQPLARIHDELRNSQPEVATEQIVAKVRSPLEDKLDKIKVGELQFEDQPLYTAIANLRDRVEQVDPSGINFVIKVLAPAAPEGEEARSANEVFRVNAQIEEEVPLRQVLELICDAAQTSSGSDLRIDYRVDESAVLIYSDNVSIERCEPMFIPISYDFPESPEDLREFFQTYDIDFKSSETVVRYNSKSKVLFAKNTPTELAKLVELLPKLGEKERQVSVNVRFLEVSLEDLQELGFDWMLTRIPPEGADINSIPFRFGTSISEANEFNFPSTSGVTGENAIQPITAGNLEQPVPNALRSIGNDGIGTTYGNQAGLTKVYDKAFWWRYTADRRVGSETDPTVPNLWGKNWTKGVDVDVAIRALSQSETSEVLACPKITTKEGEEAYIEMIRNIYYPIDWTKPQVNAINNNTINNNNNNNNNNNENGNRLPVGIIGSTPDFNTPTPIGITLTVTPEIDKDNNVTLKMNPRILAFAGWIDYSYSLDLNNDGIIDEETELQTITMPSIERREVDTKVKVKSGSTVVMGGALRDKVYTLRDRIPILGDIPLVGRFFRTEGENATKTNLLIFVTPEILTAGGLIDDGALSEVGVPRP